MLKIIFLLLLALNGALFAWHQGYLDQRQVQRREPQRLQQQLHPEQLILALPRVVPASVPASVPPPVVSASLPIPPPLVPTACVEIGNFERVEAQQFRLQLVSAKLAAQATERVVQEGASFLVFIPAQDGRDGAQRKVEELRRLGLRDFYIFPESLAMRDAISLGVFKTEAAAKLRIGQLIEQGVRSARIMQRPSGGRKLVFHFNALNAAEQASLMALSAAFPNQARSACDD